MFVTVITDYEKDSTYAINTIDLNVAMKMLEPKLEKINSQCIIKNETLLPHSIKIYESVESIQKGWFYNSHLINNKLLFKIETIPLQTPLHKDSPKKSYDYATDFITELKHKVALRNKRLDCV